MRPRAMGCDTSLLSCPHKVPLADSRQAEHLHMRIASAVHHEDSTSSSRLPALTSQQIATISRGYEKHCIKK